LRVGAVIVSDDAGLPGLDSGIRVGEHALCWVHGPSASSTSSSPPTTSSATPSRSPGGRSGGSTASSKTTSSLRTPKRAAELSARFGRIFKRRTGYATLDRLLRRLLRRKDELLRVLERPDIPLNTNASENDIRAFVAKRKISGGTVSERGRQTRDALLGLAKTCNKLRIPFFDYLGARLGIAGPARAKPRNSRQPTPNLNRPAREFAPVTMLGRKLLESSRALNQ
jgi:Transposase IS66 family